MAFCEPVAKNSTVDTPGYIFDPLNEEFGFHRDVCATAENSKCEKFWDIHQNGLAQHWTGTLWMNPPYGKYCGRWVKKAYDAACSGDATVVCLLPVRSGNSWWSYCIAGEIRFIRGRINFVGMVNRKTGKPQGAMFDVAVVIFHAHLDPGGIMKIWEPRKIELTDTEKLAQSYAMEWERAR